MNKHLEIWWHHSLETYTVTLGPTPSDNEISITEEYWPEDDRWFKYRTTSARAFNPDGSQILTVCYRAELNTHIPEDEVYWGTSTIFISADHKITAVTWKSFGPDEPYDGPPRWYALEDLELTAEREREIISRAKRKQASLRELLLARDGGCAITGETTPAVLDVAHIVEVADSGADSLNNVFLLRSDIHRLFDAGLLTIGEKGKLTWDASLSQEYKNLFRQVGDRESGIPKRVLDRVASALRRRNSLT